MSLYDTFKETNLQNSWSSKSLKCCKVVASFPPVIPSTSMTGIFPRQVLVVYGFETIIICVLVVQYIKLQMVYFVVKNVEHWQRIHSVLSFRFALWWAAFFMETCYFNHICRSDHICFIAGSRVEQFKLWCSRIKNFQLLFSAQHTIQASGLKRRSVDITFWKFLTE